MGTMTFQLPQGVPAEAGKELERACMAGGPDTMHWPLEKRFADGIMVVSRSEDESGCLVAPSPVEGAGWLMGSTATLIERDRPYNLLVELARGKLNQVRSQAADWLLGGLPMPPPFEQALRDGVLALARAVTGPPEDADAQARQALRMAHVAADQLVHTYVEQVFQIRHQRQPKLETTLGCGIGTTPLSPPQSEAITAACNGMTLPISWRTVENEEETYQWGIWDAQVAWASKQGLPLAAGPLIDFSPSQLPSWLWLFNGDVHNLTHFMCRFVKEAVARYRKQIPRWQVTAASNSSTCLSLSDDDLLQLTYRLADAARQADPGIELILGIGEPWGEYTAAGERCHPPFLFADTLVRSGLNIAALDLEVVMGVQPRGNYCHDLLDLSRLLDLYALLGVPLRVTLGYPSASGPDPQSDDELSVAGGYWSTATAGCGGGGGYTPAVQASWAEAVAALCVCKPSVQGVQWVHLSDAEPHQFPHCGLLDASGAVKPAHAKLRDIRQAHLQ
jgi:hypothetical protein